jgi:hypothetical protein
MANQDASFGLRPVRMMNGSPFSNAQNRYRIASGATGAIYQGDLVKLVTGGGVQRYTSGDTGLIAGVFNGCFYTDPTTKKPTFKNYYPGSISADDIVASVIDGPDTVFEIQADAAFPIADLFGNFNIVDQSPVGDTNSGTSRLELDVTTGATTATLPLKAIDISQDPENSDVSSANTNVLVIINNHAYRAGTAGLA